jgi:hypothetical protein
MPTDVDPAIQLQTILTAAGATIAAALIAAFIQLAKRIPVLGPWIDDAHEPGVAVLLAAGLTAYAYFVTTPAIDAFNGFAAFVAFLGIAGLATKAYDVAPHSFKTVLGGAG